MPNCSTCGVAMGASERTKNHKGAAGNWHTDCELLEHMRDDGAPSNDFGYRSTVLTAITRLSARKVSQSDAPTVALTAAIAVGGAMTPGVYLYKYTNVSASGESMPSPASAGITAASTSLQGALSVIAAGPAGTTKRKVYRTQSSGSVYNLLTTINDNTTTVFTDNVADVTIVAAAALPVFTTFTAGDFP
jgi:hypothetical protein